MAATGSDSTTNQIPPDDTCSLLDEHLWYENDLLLAAELGKTLLDRNRDLECKLTRSEARNEEYELEIELLLKQVDALRDLNESKMSVYEEVDRHSQEVDKQNEKLKLQLDQEKEKYENSIKSKRNLEIQSDEWRIYAEGLEKQVKELQERLVDPEGHCRDVVSSLSNIRSSDRHSRRATSVPNVYDDQSSFENNHVVGVKSFWPPPGAADWDCATPVNYRLRILGLTAELRTERQRNRNQLDEIDQLLAENKSLKDELQSCTECLRQFQIDKEDLNNVANTTRDVVTPTPDFTNTIQNNWDNDLYSNVEHDYPMCFTQDVQRHVSGAQIYSPLPLDRGTHQNESLFELTLRYEALSKEYEAFIRQREEHKRYSGNDAESSTCAETEDNWQEDGPGLPSFTTNTSSSTSRCGGVGGSGGGGLHLPSNSLSSSTMSLTPSIVFQRKLDHIFSEENRQQRKGIMKEDYKPKYKELFRDAFELLRQMKEAEYVAASNASTSTATATSNTNNKKRRRKRRRNRNNKNNNANINNDNSNGNNSNNSNNNNNNRNNNNQ